MHSPITELEQLAINNKSRNYLKEISRWTFFLSIIGFIGIAFMVVLGFFSNAVYGDIINSSAGQFPFDFSLVMTGVYLFFALIYFMPVLYLFKFSRNLKQALTIKNDDKLADALEMLKSHYKFMGVFMIIILSLYAMLFVFGLLGIALM